MLAADESKIPTHVGARHPTRRWQIELFFKALKHNLKIKTFVGASENAVNVQIWTTLSPDPCSHTDLFVDLFGLYGSRNLP